MKRWLLRKWEYILFGLDFFFLHKDHPYIIGLVTNDTCNLNCIHCRVANVYHNNLRFTQIREILEKYYRIGARFLYLEGGEPYLWHDGKLRLGDIVRLARNIGYLRIHIYTNGTVGLDANPDFTWISIDGLEDTYLQIRGSSLQPVLENIRGFTQRFAIIFVVNTINYKQIRDFLAFVQNEFPGIRVMFFFHTPYYGIDELFLSHDQKKDAIDTILACKRSGFPVLNTHAGLKMILNGISGFPFNYWWVVDLTGEYKCCRVNGDPTICKHCGYSSCTEIILAHSWNFEAILGMLRMF